MRSSLIMQSWPTSRAAQEMRNASNHSKTPSPPNAQLHSETRSLPLGGNQRTKGKKKHSTMRPQPYWSIKMLKWRVVQAARGHAKCGGGAKMQGGGVALKLLDSATWRSQCSEGKTTRFRQHTDRPMALSTGRLHGRQSYSSWPLDVHFEQMTFIIWHWGMANTHTRTHTHMSCNPRGFPWILQGSHTARSVHQCNAYVLCVIKSTSKASRLTKLLLLDLDQ